MKRYVYGVAVLLCLTTSTGVFAQSTVGTLTGFVTSVDKAALPGVTIKVTNEDVGITQSTLTNETGSYSFILAPGARYTVAAEFIGFKKAVIKDITVRMADTQHVDITLEVGDVTVSVEVSEEKNELMRQLTQNIGIVLDETQLQQLPLVGNDPLTLITTLPGYRANPLGHEYDTIGGLPMTMINTVRDGLSVTDGFNPGGVGSNTILNPDMISEIRLILNPVDAEAGRGNGQVQITTKSGTNRFQWNINYNLRQNAFNALGPSTTRARQPFGATFQYLVSVGGPIWKNHTFYFVNWDHQMRFQRAGNNVDFFAVGSSGFGGYLAVPVLTETARNGIFRYWDGWVSGNLSEAIPTTTTSFCTGAGTNGATCAPRWPTDVTAEGLPVAPAFWADTLNGTNFANRAPYTGTMKCFSVFGNVKFDGTPFDPAVDCGLYIPRAGDINDPNSWVPDYGNPVYGIGVLPTPGLHPGIQDPLVAGGTRLTWEQASRLFDRPPDRSGYTQRLLAYMPLPNAFFSSQLNGGQLSQFGFTNPVGNTGNDSMNKAQFAWVRGTEGNNSRNAFRGGTFGFGTGLDQQNVSHKVINLKIDHNVGNHTRISMSTSLQDDMNSRLLFQSRWPDGVDGFTGRVPRVLTINGITTISSRMVNEARFGLNMSRSTQVAPWDNPADSSKAEFARSFLQSGWIDPNNGETTPIYFLPGSETTNYDYSDNILPYGTSGSNSGLSGNNFNNPGGLSGNGAGPIPTSCNTDLTRGSFASGTYSSVNCETGFHLYNFADTFSVNLGNHSIRVGGEIRLTRAHELSGKTIPQALGGPSTGTTSDLATVCLTTCATTGIPEMPGFSSSAGHGGRLLTEAQRSADLLYFLSGSMISVSQTFWANSLQNYRDGTWETWSIGDGSRARKQVQNEMAFFFKDDWKVTQRLTLNLGVRYEDYGNLYMQGFATGIADVGYGLFGPGRMRGPNPFDYWLTPGNMFYTGYGPTPPAIDVTGQFLPDGTPSYIPGNCPVGTTGCVNPGGVGVQVVPAASTSVFTSTVNCVYGVTQVTPLAQLPTSNCDPTLLTSRVFVGPGSDHPDQSPLYRDKNNIGPAIGFSYRMPLGSRTILIRGGFQFTYGSAGRDRNISTGTAGQLTQTTGGGNTVASDQNVFTCSTPAACLGQPGLANSARALLISDLPNLVPLQNQLCGASGCTVRPTVGGSGAGTGGANPPGGGLAGDRIFLIQNFGVQRNLSATAFAPDYQDPRTENYTFSVSTNLTRTSSLALTYAGTLGRNRPTAVNLNMPNVYHNPELFEALTMTRAGGDSPLFDQMFAGHNLTGLTANDGFGAVGTCVAPTAPANPSAAQLAKRDALIANAPGGGVGNCPVGTYYQSGSAHLRRAQTGGPGTFGTAAENMANGNLYAVANIIAGVNGLTVNQASANWNTSLAGSLLRNGCNRLAAATSTNRLDLISGSETSGNTGQVRCFPEDYIIMNPGLSMGTGTGAGSGSATNGAGLVYKSNWGYTNYHQFQAQYTLRLASVNLQATYLTSKTLAMPRDFYRTNTFSPNSSVGTGFGTITGFADPQTEESRRRDYGLASDSLKHAVRLNGIFEMPFGAGKLLFNKAPGWVQNILGGWRFGVIYNGQSGQPFSIVAGDTMFGSNLGTASNCDAYAGIGFSAGANCASGLVAPDVVSPLWSNPKGRLKKNGVDGSLTFFGNPSPFALIKDPQCSSMVGRSPTSDVPLVTTSTTPVVTQFNLSSSCNLQALVMKVHPGTPGAFPLSDTDPTPVLIMLQNPKPGSTGSMGFQTMTQPGRFYLDANLAKRIMFTETRGIEIRVDATNVLNHPSPADMYISLGPTTTPESAIVDSSNSTRSAFSSGCVGFNLSCGRQVQFSFRMINN